MARPIPGPYIMFFEPTMEKPGRQAIVKRMKGKAFSGIFWQDAEGILRHLREARPSKQ
jgi:hypothetical protein